MKILKEINEEVRKITNFKVSEREREIIEKMAKKYTKGNKSLWIRYAATHFKPKANELKSIR